MSKLTYYSKIYPPNVRFVRTSTDVVRTSARVRIYPADAFLPVDGFLPSAPIVKKRICADGLMCPCGPARVRVDTRASARMQACVRADQLFPTSTSLPLALPCTSLADGLMHPRRRSADAQNFYFYIFLGSCCLLEKRGKKYSVFDFRFSISKIPELHGLRGLSHEKKKVFSA
jgi:hypothetical protein